MSDDDMTVANLTDALNDYVDSLVMISNDNDYLKAEIARLTQRNEELERDARRNKELFDSMVLLWAEYTGGHIPKERLYERMNELCFDDAALDAQAKEDKF